MGEFTAAKAALRRAQSPGAVKTLIDKATNNQFESAFASFNHTLNSGERPQAFPKQPRDVLVIPKRVSGNYRRNVESLKQEVLENWLKADSPYLRQIGRFSLGAEVFKIDNVYAYTHKMFHESKGASLELENQYLKLPYPCCLFEYDYKLSWQMYTADKEVAAYCEEKYGDHARDNGYTDGLGKVGVMCAMEDESNVIFNILTTRPRLQTMYTLKMGVNPETGMCRFLADGEPDLQARCEGHFRMVSHDEQQNLLNVACGIMTPVLYAVNLLGCKNVRPYVKEQSSHTGKTRAERRREPEHVYRILDVPLINKIASGEINIGGDGSAPIHTVRGHFKTFTAAKPLLGRHVGRWWWNPMVRGNADNGIVEKEYSVHLPENQ